MQRVTKRRPTRRLPAAILAPVALALLLAACGGGGAAPAATPTPAPSVAPTQQASGSAPAANAPAVTASPTGQSTDKVDVVFTQLQAIYQSQGLDAATQFARDQGLLTKQNEIRMTLVLDTDDSAVSDSTALATTRLGGRVTSASGDQLEIVVPIQTLIDYAKTTNRQSLVTDLADFQHVKTITRTAMAEAPVTPTPARTSSKVTGAKSEGVAFTGADKWQAAGITGKGIKIGILDIAFYTYKQFLSDAKVTTRSFRSDGLIEDPSEEEGIHGTACAEIVHEMAPDAEIYLVTAQTEGEDAAAIRWLTSTAGVSVISASVGFPGGRPTNDTSLLAQEVDRAKAAGVFVAFSAGNDANGKIGTDSGEGHYGATFTDNDKDGFHDFPGAKNKNGLIMAVSARRPIRLTLDWDDWTKPHVNYDLYLFDTNGREIGRSDNNQAAGRLPPVELISGTVPAGNYIIKIKKVNPSDPNVAFNLFFRGVQLEQVTAPNSLTVPTDAKGAVSVAAINVKTGKVEDFSSQGTTLDGRKKPDIGAPDNTSGFAYASIGEASFPGTSAAAPHMAGAAGLFKQAFPDATPDAMLRFFSDHAKKPQGTPAGDNVSGAGVLFLDAVPQNASTRPAATRAISTTPIAATPVTGTAATATAATATRPASTQAAGTRAPTSAPTAAGTGGSAGTGGAAFVDNFTSPSSGLPAAGYQNGQYRFRADVLVTATYPKFVKDAGVEVYEVTAQRTGGASDAVMGLEVRRLDKDNYLLFVIGNDGSFGIYARANGSLQQLGKGGTSAAIKANAPNVLRVSIVGTKFAFAVNGQVVEQVDITDIWTQGAFGFVGGGGQSGPADLAFSNYSLKLG